MEAWWAPSDYATPEHSHDDSSSEFTILWARNRRIYRRIGDRVDEYIAHTPRVWGKFLSVRAGVVHAFERGTSPMIWLAFETWRKGCKVSSVAEDFHLA